MAQLAEDADRVETFQDEKQQIVGEEYTGSN